MDLLKAQLQETKTFWCASVTSYERSDALPTRSCPSNIPTVRLRQATDADDDFCLQLNIATMREYIEPIYGWDIDEQHRLHVRYFKPQRLLIIEDDNGAAIGLLEVSDKGDHLYVSRIEVRPEAQGRGVGTAVMDGLIREGRTIRLRVFKNNVALGGSMSGSGSSSTTRPTTNTTYRCTAPAKSREGHRSSNAPDQGRCDARVSRCTWSDQTTRTSKRRSSLCPSSYRRT
jgi:ribosomal protein S18 acetylase RimI-like enzyme